MTARDIAAMYLVVSRKLEARFWSEIDSAIDEIAGFPQRHHYDPSGLFDPDFQTRQTLSDLARRPRRAQRTALGGAGVEEKREFSPFKLVSERSGKYRPPQYGVTPKMTAKNAVGARDTSSPDRRERPGTRVTCPRSGHGRPAHEPGYRPRRPGFRKEWLARWRQTRFSSFETGHAPEGRIGHRLSKP